MNVLENEMLLYTLIFKPYLCSWDLNTIHGDAIEPVKSPHSFHMEMLCSNVFTRDRKTKEEIIKIHWDFYKDMLYTVYSSDNFEWTVMTQYFNFVI